jgi:hypothetical protein
MAKVTGTTLAAAAFGGLINEDLMQQIWDISNIPLPLADAIGSGSHVNSYAEWQLAALAAPDTANAKVDGADVSDNNEKIGTRVGNQSQISTKRVQVSTRAQHSDVAGQSDALAYQVMERQKELRRDVDAIAVTQQASVADNGTVPGKSAGLGAWLTTNVSRGATGANGGFAAGIVATPTNGTARALSETNVRNVAQSVYQAGGNASMAMSTPALIRKFSEYLFTATAKVATLMSDVGQAREAAVAKGSINVFVTDFGITLELVANRLQPTVDATHVNFYLIDPEHLELSNLAGYRVEELAKTGLADNRLMSVDWTLKVLNEAAQGVVADNDPALAAVS